MFGSFRLEKWWKFGEKDDDVSRPSFDEFLMAGNPMTIEWRRRLVAFNLRALFIKSFWRHGANVCFLFSRRSLATLDARRHLRPSIVDCVGVAVKRTSPPADEILGEMKKIKSSTHFLDWTVESLFSNRCVDVAKVNARFFIGRLRVSRRVCRFGHNDRRLPRQRLSGFLSTSWPSNTFAFGWFVGRSVGRSSYLNATSRNVFHQSSVGLENQQNSNDKMTAFF